jgi:hypothetical protein
MIKSIKEIIIKPVTVLLLAVFISLSLTYNLALLIPYYIRLKPTVITSPCIIINIIKDTAFLSDLLTTIVKPWVNVKACRRFLHISFDSKTSPLFGASNQGSGIAAIVRLRAGRRCAGIDGKRWPF